jgi:hypothetical protein
MARSIFFSFHYDDVSSFRANVVRNSWLTMRDRSANFIDKSIWEEAEKKGVSNLKDLIEKGLKGTSVTVVLVGTETYSRRWVKYEIVKSFTEGKGVLPIYINRIPSKNEGIKAKGVNPLDKLAVDVSSDCKKLSFYELINGKWIPFKDLLTDNNRTTNSFYFEDGWFNEYKGGKAYKFSDLFDDGYDWISGNGYDNFADWINEAAELVGR